tara:strand:+ start:264 stop:593 length:330 start_codon:yes stop_codon:yes gene_type:complete
MDNFDNFDDMDGMDGLTLSQKMEVEELIIDAAFRNSFKIVTGRRSLEQLLDKKSEDPNAMHAICAHEPGEEPSMETLENMMAYFVETEEYEKCAEIRDIINVRLQGKTR